MEIAREPTEGRRDRRVDRVASATWRHADPETPAPALTLALPTLAVAEAVVVVDEGDNSALPLGRPTLLLPAYRLRYFRDTSAAASSLVYGRADLGAPRYDIALLAPRLLGAAAHEVTMGPERQAPPAPADLLPTGIFWGVLAGAVVALLLIARLVRQSDAPPAPSAPPPPSPAAAVGESA